MSKPSTFTATQAQILSGEIPDILAKVRTDIVNGAGFPVDGTTIRVRQRELLREVLDRASGMVPEDAAGVAAILADEPDLLEEHTEENGSRMILHEVRDAVIERIIDPVRAVMRSAISRQHAGADFASVIEEIRSTLPALAELDSGLADAVERECEDQTSRKAPSCRALLPVIDRARQELTIAGRLGDLSKFVHARALMEIADLIDMQGLRLDRTHVPPAGPAHTR